MLLTPKHDIIRDPPKEILMNRSKKSRKSVYEIDEQVKEKLNLLKETVADDIEHLQIKKKKMQS
jgi:hypothetical protein